MKNIGIFLSENFPFSVVKFSIYLNRRVFVMFVVVPSLEKKRVDCINFVFSGMF